MDYARELNILEHREYGDRCEIATKLFEDKKLTIPCLIDGMDNRVNEAYLAHPDRIFLVRSDGRLAVAGERGPAGFEPALNEVRRWLVDFRRKESEPKLPATAEEPGDERHVTPVPADADKDKDGSGGGGSSSGTGSGGKKADRGPSGSGKTEDDGGSGPSGGMASGGQAESV